MDLPANKDAAHQRARDNLARAEAAEAKLRAVGELPKQWDKNAIFPSHCSDELRAILGDLPTDSGDKSA